MVSFTKLFAVAAAFASAVTATPVPTSEDGTLAIVSNPVNGRDITAPDGSPRHEKRLLRNMELHTSPDGSFIVLMGVYVSTVTIDVMRETGQIGAFGQSAGTNFKNWVLTNKPGGGVLGAIELGRTLYGMKNLFWGRSGVMADFGFYMRLVNNTPQTLDAFHTWIAEWAAASGLTLDLVEHADGFAQAALDNSYMPIPSIRAKRQGCGADINVFNMEGYKIEGVAWNLFKSADACE